MHLNYRAFLILNYPAIGRGTRHTVVFCYRYSFVLNYPVFDQGNTTHSIGLIYHVFYLFLIIPLLLGEHNILYYLIIIDTLILSFSPGEDNIHACTFIIILILSYCVGGTQHNTVFSWFLFRLDFLSLIKVYFINLMTLVEWLKM